MDGSTPTTSWGEHTIEAGRRRWKERAAAVADAHGGVSSFSAMSGISKTTVADSTDTRKSGPSLTTMLAWHIKGDFHLTEQVRLLFGLDYDDLDVRRPLWKPATRVATDDLIQALQRAIEVSDATHPSIWDLGSAVARSCHESQDFGRWRSRFFDIPVGWQFRHVGYQGVEFMRWYGPGLGVDEEPEETSARGRELVAGPQVPRSVTDKWLHDDYMKLEDVPSAFEPEKGDSPLRQVHWDQFRHERAELEMRLGDTLIASRANWYGAFGTQTAPLLRNQVSPTARHMLIQTRPSARTRPDDTQTVWVSTDLDVQTVLLIGSGAAMTPFVAHCLAEALGWDWVSSGDLSHRLTGRRIPLRLHRDNELDRAAIDAYAQAPSHRTVLSSHISYLRDGTGGRLSLLPEARRLLRNPRVLPILLRPDIATLELWEQRQDGSAAKGRASALNQATSQEEHYDFLAEELKRIPGAISAPLMVSIPWSGEAVSGATPAPDARPRWFQHPIIGDLGVRAAYELARVLRNPASLRFICGDAEQYQPQRGRPRDSGLTEVEERAEVMRTNALEQPIGFAPGSLLAAHEPALRAVTGGQHWRDRESLLSFDPRFEHPAPGGNQPFRGKVLSLRLVGGPRPR